MITSYGLWRRTAHARTETHGRPQQRGHHAFLWEKRSARQLHRSTREAALGYDREAVSYGIGDAQRTHGQVTRTGAAAAEDTTRSYGRAKRTPATSKHRREAALGYDPKLKLWNRDAQRMRTDRAHARAPRSRRTLRVLMGESARPQH
jgi:hypothetical protein